MKYLSILLAIGYIVLDAHGTPFPASLDAPFYGSSAQCMAVAAAIGGSCHIVDPVPSSLIVQSY